MPREVEIDRAVYEVDDAARTYRFVRCNPAWREQGRQEVERLRRSLDGYTRVFRDGRRRVFRMPG